LEHRRLGMVSMVYLQDVLVDTVSGYGEFIIPASVAMSGVDVCDECNLSLLSAIDGCSYRNGLIVRVQYGMISISGVVSLKMMRDACCGFCMIEMYLLFLIRLPTLRCHDGYRCLPALEFGHQLVEPLMEISA